MSITYNLNIPDGPHNPSQDQPLMKVNTNSISTLIGIDHVAFNASGGDTSGYHKQVTFNGPLSNPVLSPSHTQIYPKTFGSGATSYLETYTAADTQGGSQINGYLPFVKCITSFLASNAPVGPPVVITPIANALIANVASITVQKSGSFQVITITFTTPLPYTTYMVFKTGDTITDVSYTKNNASLVLSTATITPGSYFGIMVI